MEKTKEKKSVGKIIFNIIFYTVVGLVILAALFITVSSIQNKEQGYTKIFGNVLQSVQTESMEGTIDKGDLIFSKVLSNEEKTTLQKGDIVSFFWMVDNGTGGQQRIIVTHQIIDVNKEMKYYVCKGTSPKVYDDDIQNVAFSDVIAKYNGTKFSGFGKFTDWLKTDTGFIVCIIIPVAAFLIYQIIVFVITIKRYKKINNQEEIEKKARELAEQMAKESAGTQTEPAEEQTTE